MRKRYLTPVCTMALFMGSLLSTSVSAEASTSACDSPYAYIHCGNYYYAVCNKRVWDQYADESFLGDVSWIVGAVGGVGDFILSALRPDRAVVDSVNKDGNAACYSLRHKLQVLQQGLGGVVALPATTTLSSQYTRYDGLKRDGMVVYVNESAVFEPVKSAYPGVHPIPSGSN